MEYIYITKKKNNELNLKRFLCFLFHVFIFVFVPFVLLKLFYFYERSTNKRYVDMKRNEKFMFFNQKVTFTEQAFLLIILLLLLLFHENKLCSTLFSNGWEQHKNARNVQLICHTLNMLFKFIITYNMVQYDMYFFLLWIHKPCSVIPFHAIHSMERRFLWI